ncbi:DUF6493 family protein [Streptomyces sp. NPDC058195]|uniref:DUF7824 domain-containing protein n=1 Tax=Streptomyces sp. NPDC058195 TaxID=3346375 RepID=UPI0036EF1845
MSELMTAVRESRTHELPGLLARMDQAERRAALVELKALRKEKRGWEWDKQRTLIKPLLVAGAGCHTGAAACATWISGRDLVWDRAPFPLVVAALADRDPAWLGDVAHRLAARPATAEMTYDLIHRLVLKSQCPVPTTEGFVRGWLESVSSFQWRRQKRRPLIDVLRADPFASQLLPRIFDVQELPPQMLWAYETDDPGRWDATLATLPQEGLLERQVLVDGCVTRLLRGGKPGDQRFFLGVLRLLALTGQEEAERAADWIGMASDAMSTVAAHAQQVLGRLDERGELSVRTLAEVSAAVLFRTEKKLVRSQLVLLGKVLRRDPSAAGELLPVVASAFEHEDIDVQERALKLVGRHLSAAGPAVREELALSASLLGPAHRALVAEVFGAPAAGQRDVEPYEEVLPPAPVARRLGPAPATLPELVEDVVVLVRSSAPDVSVFERALDGLVRHANADRPGLTCALRDALAGEWWMNEESWRSEPRDWTLQQLRSADGIEPVLATLLGRLSPQVVAQERASWTGTGTCAHAAFQGILRARVWEAADAALTGGLPFLLAVPTWHTGSLDAAVLVERLREYQRLGFRPGEADFAQAMLRVRRREQHDVAAAAERLEMPEGDRLAAWLRADRPLAEVYRFDLEKKTRRGQTVERSRRILMATKESPFIEEVFPRSFHWLGRPQIPAHHPCYHWREHPEHWTATLPEDAETLAAWLLPNTANNVVEEIRDAVQPLTLLAELDGPAGEALHLTVAYGLGARHPEERLAAVDALLILATQRRLDPVLLGEQVAALLDCGLTKPTRLADSVRTAAVTGAYRTVLRVLTGVLPGVLAHEKAPRGAGDLLAVAAECVEHCGATAAEEIPGLAETAARGGASQLVRQAKRLAVAWKAGAPRG